MSFFLKEIRIHSDEPVIFRKGRSAIMETKNSVFICESSTLTFSTTAGTDVIDITRPVAEKVAESRIAEGQVLVFTPGSTAALTTIEYESGVVRDLIEAIERLASKDMDYRHDARWGDGNGYAHVRSALLGPSLSVPVMQGRLALGTWQQIVLIDFDNRPRKRQVVVQLSGLKVR
jgi:secondary thiamine-phosphate synthase enzyme